MARPLRIEYEGAFYHITARGNERHTIFYDKTDYERFKSYLKEAKERYGYILHCYVLMTNHYHLLIETPQGNMSQVMHYVNASYTNYLNKKRGRSGHLFQGRYKAILIDHNNYLLELSRYMHLNPVRVHLVERPEEYAASSYRSYISKEREAIVSPDLILGMISRDHKSAVRRYRAFVEMAIGKDLQSPLKDVYGGVILGGQQFIKDALSKLKETVWRQEDIAQRRELLTAWRAEDIMGTVAQYFDLSLDEFLADGKAGRYIAIYLLKSHAGMTNRQIGGLFGDISYSAVAKAHQRFSVKLAKDRSLQRTVKEIRGRMSYVKT
jgi:putative transposase